MKLNKITPTLLVIGAILVSCNNDLLQEEIEKTNAPTTSTLSGEAKAIETFNHFLEQLNNDPTTKATASKAIITEVKKVSTANYGAAAKTKGKNKGLSVYELSLRNDDNSNGFAVVTDAAIFDEVIAYVPLGSIADTMYNKALALYFRELAMISDAIENQAETKADYWQPGWQDVFTTQVSSDQFVRWLTQWEIDNYSRPYSWVFYDPVDKMETKGAYVPTQWNQTKPYNNKVPVFQTKNPSERVVTGCYAVAVGQVMAYHKKPTKYNWSILTASKTIASGNIAAADEVSRLLLDIGKAGIVEYNSEKNIGKTYTINNIPGMNKMGYSAQSYWNEAGTYIAKITEEIKTNNRPVIFRASGYEPVTGNYSGHIWVIDGVITQERWKYYSFWRTSPDADNGKCGLNRHRVQGNLVHCNWGWGGQSDGWFYSFRLPRGNDFMLLNSEKLLYTNIKPQ